MSGKRQERAAFERNQQLLKALLKEPGNKFCSDCKKHAYPRWASWNLGVFICIRCSGIHRSMGTHISRVKSVDLDSWTEEQLQSMVRWGNIKANKYWEAKLPGSHQPMESKIENFIRTKYELKRWCAPGPVPDPDTISDTERESEDEAADLDDPAPLKKAMNSTTKKYSSYEHKKETPKLAVSDAYQKKQQLIGSVTARPASTPASGTASFDIAPLVGSTAVKGSSTIRLKVEQPKPPPTPSKPSDDLLGLGASSAPISRAASAAPNLPPASTANLRPDLKSSILSLYSKPWPQPGTGPSYASPSPQFAPGFNNNNVFANSSSSSSAASSTAATPTFGISTADLVNPFSDMSISSQRPVTVPSGMPSFNSTPISQTPGPMYPSSATTSASPTPVSAASNDPFAGLASANAWSAPPTVNASKPAIALDDDLENEFGSFQSSSTPSVFASSGGVATNLSIDFFDSPSFSNPIPLGSSSAVDSLAPTPTDTPGRAKTDEEIFGNVWG
ncbi:uncharacterized protein V1518DRAFT_421842 [Limtongia smithiae]|uniref:uncharacterized protein n=1 Tax=Limtongia smithiae TaxID=1125753 RepID=UPI0034CF2848